MPRWITIPDPVACDGSLVADVGDLLVFSAVGGRMDDGDSAIRYLGAFVSALVGENGAVLTSEGLPNVAVFEATGPGRAGIQVITAMDFASATPHPITVTVRS